jgi:hypothetical protein
VELVDGRGDPKFSGERAQSMEKIFPKNECQWGENFPWHRGKGQPYAGPEAVGVIQIVEEFKDCPIHPLEPFEERLDAVWEKPPLTNPNAAVDRAAAPDPIALI